jgi:SAM-dependent methyltransferase
LRGIVLRIKGATKDHYCIKPEYFPRNKYIQFDARYSSDRYQDGVYQRIKNFVVDQNLYKIIDVGCGSGYKLLKYFGEYDTLGLEMSSTYKFLREKYPFRKWEISDFNNPPKQEFDIVISIDVIEHLIDLDELITFLQAIKCDYIVLSTPDRKKLSLFSHFRPTNIHHIREWSQLEFCEYVSSCFTIRRSEVIDHHDHLIIAQKRSGNQ